MHLEAAGAGQLNLDIIQTYSNSLGSPSSVYGLCGLSLLVGEIRTAVWAYLSGRRRERVA